MPLQAIAQIPYAYSFSEQENFSSSTVYYLHEDSERNMWFATNSGLYKWDGGKFLNIKNVNYPTSYSSIQEDSTGRIWCLNFTGQFFYVKNDSLVLFSDEQSVFKTALDYSVSFYPKIFACSDYGITEFDFYAGVTQYSLGTATKVKQLDKTMRGEAVRLIQPYKDGLLYYYKNKLIYSNDNGIFSLATFDKNINCTAVPNIFQFKDRIIIVGNKWTNSKKVPFIFEYSQLGKLKEIKLDFTKELNNSSMFYDSSNDLLWLGTTNGLVVLNSKYKSVYTGQFMPNKNISDIIQDQEGNVWVSTLNSGVYIIPSTEVLYYPFSSDNRIISVLKTADNQKYFVKEYGDILKFSTSGEFLKVGDFSQKLEGVRYNPNLNVIHAGNNLSEYNLTTKLFQTNIYGRNIKDISYLRPGCIFASTSSSAELRLDLSVFKDSGFIKSLVPKGAKHSQTWAYDYYSYEIRNKRTHFHSFNGEKTRSYISFSDGLFLLSDKELKEVLFNNESIFLTSLSDFVNNKVWGTTISGDLLEVEGTSVSKVLPLAKQTIRIVHRNNSLFLGTEEGVVKYDLKTKKEMLLNKYDGLPKGKISNLTIINDTLYVTTTSGVAVLNCSFIGENGIKPKVDFAKVQILEKDTALLNHYILDYNQNNITFYYKALSTRSQGSYRFMYRMLGLDSTWINTSSSTNFARFPSIPTGDYRFEVKVLNEDDVESEVASIQLVIDSPFYEKWWFYLLYVAIIVGIVSSFFIVRIRIIKKQNFILQSKKEIEKELSQSQLSALQSQMNPHFIFNALNSIQDYIISNDKELASDYLGLFADLMRKYLHFSQLNEVHIADEIEALDMYLQLENVRFDNTLDFSIVISPELKMSNMKLPVMLLQPFVENSIKHGLFHKKGSRKLVVSFHEDTRNLIIKIKDNGVGRVKSAEILKRIRRGHTSFATSAIQKRMSLINLENENTINIKYNDLYNDLGVSLGTEVCISIKP